MIPSMQVSNNFVWAFSRCCAREAHLKKASVLSRLSRVIPETPMDFNTLHSFRLSFLVALLVKDYEISMMSMFSLPPSMIFLREIWLGSSFQLWIPVGMGNIKTACFETFWMDVLAAQALPKKKYLEDSNYKTCKTLLNILINYFTGVTGFLHL